MISVAFVAALLATGVGVKVNAAVADGNRDLDTTAKFNVENGKLTLLQAPDLDFGTISVKSLVDGSSEDKVLSGNPSTKIKISNYDVNVNNWELTAKAGDFVNQNDGSNVLTGTKITLNEDKIISGDGATVLTGGHLESNESDVTAKLDLNGLDKDKVKAETYTANIDWTLSNTEATKSASSFK